MSDQTSLDLQELIEAAITSHAKAAQKEGGSGDGIKPSEEQSNLELCLAEFSALNPFTAAALAGSGLDLWQLLNLENEKADHFAGDVPGLSGKSTQLLLAQLEAARSLFALRKPHTKGLHFGKGQPLH